MADVKYDFAADVTAAERAIAALERKVEQLEHKNKQLHRTSRQGAQQSQSDFAKMGRGALSLAAGYVSVGAAVGVATRAFGSFSQEIEQARERAEKLTNELFKQLVLAGDLARFPQIQARLRNLPGATEAEGTAVYAGVRAGGPQLSFERMMALTAEGAKLGPLLEDRDLEAFGHLSARLGELAPGKSAQDVVDFTLSAQQRAGAHIGKLKEAGSQALLGFLTEEGGLAPEHAMAILLEGLEQGAEAGSLKAAFAKGLEQGVGPAQLLADPKLQQKYLEREQRVALGLLELPDIEQQRQGLLADQATDLQLRQLQIGRAADPLRFKQHQAELLTERTLREEAELERFRDAERALRIAETEPGVMRESQRIYNWLEDHVEHWVEGLTPGGHPAYQPPPVPTRETELDLGPAGRITRPVGSPSLFSKEFWAEYFTAPHTAAAASKQEETVEVLKEIRDNTSPPGRSRQPNRVNRDAHTEGNPLGGAAGF